MLQSAENLCFFKNNKLERDRLRKERSRIRNIGIMAAVAFCLECALNVPASAQPAVKLQVLNPRGEITPKPVSVPAARIADLAGKKIALYWNGKAGGNNFWDNVEELLKKRLPNTAVLRYNGAYDLGDALAGKIVEGADAFLYGVGD